MRIRTHIACAGAGVALALALPAAAQSVGQTVVGLTQGTNTLVTFPIASPGTILATIPLTGLAAGDTMRALDSRPVNGLLYGLATDGSNAVVRLYLVNATTGAATIVGASVTLPTPATAWDINFNPAVDRVRVVNDQDENARLVPDNGTLAGDDANLTASAAVNAVAYTNPFAGTPLTTLYALNGTTNSLATIGGINGMPSPNGGVVTDVGPLGVAFAGAPAALDIASNNVAFAVLRPAGGATSLYTVNLSTGAATLVGLVGDGSLAIDDIALVDPALTVSPPSGTYTARQNFDVALVANLQGAGLMSGRATFNGTDISGILAGCVRPGTGAGGLTTFRCPNIGGPVVGPGTHTFTVRLQSTTGGVVQRTVVWTVIAATEP